MSSRKRTRKGSEKGCTLGRLELDAARQTSGGKVYKFFHGTSWDKARQIEKHGFVASTEGCLGPGIYVARYEKADRFAKEFTRHKGCVGGLVEVLLTDKNPKFVDTNHGWNDVSWRDEGFDACRAESTTASTSMEWCIADSSQVRVVRTSPVRCNGDMSGGSVSAADEELALEKHAVELEAEIRERAEKVATLREWQADIKRKRDDDKRSPRG
jgi:hypothetical protein